MSMGSVVKIGGKDDPRGTRYRARWRTPDGASRSRTFARKVDAETWLTSVEHDKLSGVYVDKAAGRTTFGAYAEEWRTHQVQHRPSTAAKTADTLRLHILPTFGHRPLGAITSSEIRAWVTVKSATLAPATVRQTYGLLSTILGAAADDRKIARNPCGKGRKMALPKLERRQIVPMATDDVARLVAHAVPRFRALIVLAAGSGLRQGECLGLTVDRIDFLRRSVRVDRQLVQLPGQQPQHGPPKSNASVRVVPLPQLVLDELAAHLATYPPGPDGFVFTTEDGQPIRRTSFAGLAWHPMAKRAGLAGRHSFHDLRHYYASLLIRAGESVKVVQARLGHQSAALTLNVYSHLWPDSEDRTRSAVELALGPAVSASCHASEAQPG